MSQGPQALVFILDRNESPPQILTLRLYQVMLTCKLLNEIKHEEATFVRICEADQATCKLAAYLHVHE